MTIDLYLDVPYFERHKARDMGAAWCPKARMWYTNKTRFRSAAFKRWRDRRAWRRVKVYPDETPEGIAAAKAHGCLWDKNAKSWFVEVTGDDSTWLRAPGAFGTRGLGLWPGLECAVRRFVPINRASRAMKRGLCPPQTVG